MPGRTIDNGNQGNFQLEIKAGASGDIQIVGQEPENPITQPTAGDRRFQVTQAVTSLPNIPANAQRAQISVETAGFRWLDDPSSSVHPSASHGHLLKPPTGDSTYYWITGRNKILNFEMFAVTATPADVQVSYYE